MCTGIGKTNFLDKYAVSAPQSRILHSGILDCSGSLSGREVSFTGMGQVLQKRYLDFMAKHAEGKLAAFFKLLFLPLTAHDNFRILFTRFMQTLTDLTKRKTIMLTSASRDILRKEISQHLYNAGLPNGAIKRNKQVYIVMGLNACGKSSRIIKPLQEKYGAVLIDNDNIMTLFPEYRSGIGLNLIAAERDQIALNVQKAVISRGENVIKPNCALSRERFMKTYRLYKDGGYAVHLRFVDIDPDMASQRAVQRFMDPKTSSGERIYTDPAIQQRLGRKPFELYKQLIKERDLFESFAAYSNDVPQGEPLKFLPLYSSICKNEV